MGTKPAGTFTWDIPVSRLGKNQALAPLCHLVKTLIPQENALLTFTVYYSPKVIPLSIITLGFKS